MGAFLTNDRLASRLDHEEVPEVVGGILPQAS